MSQNINRQLKQNPVVSNIFIHIPKCGGSSFIGLLKNSTKLDVREKEIPTHRIRQVGNTSIEHIDFSTNDRRFRAPQIFNAAFNEVYQDKNVFMLVRNPFDRLYSEFNFQYHILNGKNGNPNAAIITRLGKIPNTFDEYIKFAETQNYQCKFLLGRKIADPNPVSDEEYSAIVEAIGRLNIHCGVTDDYQGFLNMFEQQAAIQLQKTVLHLKQTPSQLKKRVTKALRQELFNCNQFDLRLYQFVQETIRSNDRMQKNNFTVNSTNKFIGS